MTGMQLIIPQVEEDGSPQEQDMGRNEAPRDIEDHGHTHSGSDESVSSTQSQEGVLSQELRESFESMKAVWRQAGRYNDEESAASEELKRKERDQAVETALAIESEVCKWQNGIAELEAMLAAEEEASEEDLSEQEEDSTGEENVAVNARGYPLAPVRFPSLPPVVVPDDDDDEDEDDASSDLNTAQTDLVDSSGFERISSSG